MLSGSCTRWTTVNFAEAIQGVQTPLGWTYWSHVMESAVRRSFGVLGALPRRQVPVPDSTDERISAVFHGRAAGNVSMFRKLGDAIPGSSGDAVEAQLFGQAPPAEPSPRTPGARRRYPVVAAKLPLALVLPTRRIPRLRAEYRDWWRTSTIDHPPTDAAGARRLLQESVQNFIEIGTWHSLVSMLGVGLFDNVQALSAKTLGDASLGLELISGYGGMEETGLLVDVWRAAHDDLTVEEFLARHGYHGPDEGQLPSRVWREDPSPVYAMVTSYVGTPDPRDREAVQRTAREAAEKRLLAALPAWRRPGARVLLRTAGKLIPMRELGKAGFLHAIDGARCAARVAGRVYSDQGLLEDPEDVFYLTLDELLGPPQVDWAERIRERKDVYAQQQLVELPPMWKGVVTPREVVREQVASGARELSGLGVVGSTVTGRARVVLDARDVDLVPGDILVCRTTDPSWTPLFLVADALVIDTGGPMSHGAIVARELGVTCVINTVTGTRDIPDGATITVDGSAGTVVIHDDERVPASLEPTPS